MGSVLNSLDNMIASARANGMLSRLICDHFTPGTSGALTTCGLISGQRSSVNFTVPSLGAGLSGAYFPSLDIVQSDAAIGMIADETLLGTLTVSGNSYSHGSSMPTITDPGDTSQTIQSASMMVVAVISTSLTATTPVLTFNYTNQDGTTGRSGTITLPTNALVGSAFLVSPHLQAGDTGIRALSASGPNGLSINTGTAGLIRLYGLLPLGFTPASSIGQTGIDPLLSSTLLLKVAANDTLAIYRWGNTTTGDIYSLICGLADD